MPVYAIVLKDIVANLINADDESIATPIAKSISTDASAILVVDRDKCAIGQAWDGEQFYWPHDRVVEE